MNRRILYIKREEIDLSRSSWKDNPPIEKEKSLGWPMSIETVTDLIKSGAKLRGNLIDRIKN